MVFSIGDIVRVNRDKVATEDDTAGYSTAAVYLTSELLQYGNVECLSETPISFLPYATIYRIIDISPSLARLTPCDTKYVVATEDFDELATSWVELTILDKFSTFIKKKKHG